MPRHAASLALILVTALVAVVASGACGTFEDGGTDAVDASSEGSEGSIDAPPTTEAGASDGRPTGRCDPNAPFGQPDPVADLVTPLNQPEAWLGEDELTVYLARATGDAGTGIDLYTSSRLTLTAPFGAPVPIANVNSDVDDDNPTVTRDGLHLFFHSARGDDGGTRATRLFVASRDFTVQPFSSPMLVGGIPPSTANQLDPFVSPDGDRLYFGATSTAPGVSDQDIYMAARSSGTTFTAPPVAIVELNSSGFETQPILTSDEKVVYFTSNRDGGNFDVWRASRPDRAQPFGAPVRVPLASSTLIDTPTWVSHDDCELWIARGEFPEKRDLLRLRRPAP